MISVTVSRRGRKRVHAVNSWVILQGPPHAGTCYPHMDLVEERGPEGALAGVVRPGAFVNRRRRPFTMVADSRATPQPQNWPAISSTFLPRLSIVDEDGEKSSPAGKASGRSATGTRVGIHQSRHLAGDNQSLHNSHWTYSTCNSKRWAVAVRR